PPEPLRSLLRPGRHQGRLRAGGGHRRGGPATQADRSSIMSKVDVNALLDRLELQALNSGSWSGARGWSESTGGALIDVRNPSTGVCIGQVRAATWMDYEAVMRSAAEAAPLWRLVPAPKRGEAVRLLGEELRRCKTDLGMLVSLENGKSHAEGLGEVQEMIDIADVAVGQPRMHSG